jgi:hypothetical protein
MIDGFRLDVTAEELAAHLDTRIQHHRERTQECESKLRHLQTLAPMPHEDEEEPFEMCASSRARGIERMALRHRSRETFLTFARNHIVGTEIYRLSEEDLRLLEWLPPDESSGMMVTRF